ncbi:MAG: hypothetical protein KAI41_08775 [Hyphomicrobiaceae bacterium]|nr:hypothetical protein [Hyphomicrobiaceae bacterium]
MSAVRYPHIRVQLTGKDGNAFAIMGAVKAALRENQVAPSEIDEYMTASMAGDYDELLQTAMQWVDVR